jgi:4-hydroxy-2-oxoheptanedioate aldolase
MFRTTFLLGAVLMMPSRGLEPAERKNTMVELLASGKAIFGVFSDKTEESARALSSDDEVDFVFYDLETGPFDVETLRAFRRALGDRPLMARLPPIRDGREDARERTKLLLEAGADGVVYPHVESRDEAEHAVRSMEEAAPGKLWPPSPAGELLNFILIEDRVGVENARDIASAPGVSVVFPGPGDLRRAYEGDGPAIERAIQTVLAAAKENGVVCGITAGPGDVEKRLEEGFRVIIVTSREALPIGRSAAGR